MRRRLASAFRERCAAFSGSPAAAPLRPCCTTGSASGVWRCRLPSAPAPPAPPSCSGKNENPGKRGVHVMTGIQRFMRRTAWVLLIGLVPIVAHGADRPDWAFPVADKVQPPSQDEGQPKALTGSTKSYTQKQIDDLKNPPDWFPDMHPPMPSVVAQGTATFACGSCHLPVGTGHDESAYLAALPAAYIVRQMADFKSGARMGFGAMPAIAQAIGDADVQSAAAYFSSLAARPWIRVVETDTVPRTYVNPGNMRLALPNGGT